MKTLLYILFIFNFTVSFSQSYTYKKLDLDTSCFWVYDYYYYQGGYPECQGIKVISVEKDTLIGLNKFFKLRSYTSDKNISWPTYICDPMYFSDKFIYLHEDTITEKVTDKFGKVIVDYHLSVGDTMDIGLSFNNPQVDSVTIDTINSIPRRIMWGHYGTLTHYYNTIEGVGANMNFPFHEYGEWLTPVYRQLQCYSKGGVTLYPNNPSTPCTKNFPAQISTFKKQPFSFQQYGLDKIIINSDTYPIELSLFNLSGQLVFKSKVLNSMPISMGLNSNIIGPMILKLTNKVYSNSFKVIFD